MSDADELTALQRAELRADLIDLETILSQQLGQLEASAQAVDLDTPIGRLSRMDALAQQHVAKAGKDATRVRLAQVRAALRRMEEGTYGYCLRTEEPIGFARLKVRPEATLSLAGQRELESSAVPDR